MYSNDGALIGVLGIGRDITDRVNLQAQLFQAQKMESIGRLAGGVAHDFNNMLSIILGGTEIVLEELPEESPLYEYLMEVMDATKRSRRLTKQLLAFARMQTIDPQVVCLNEVIERGALKMLNRLIGENITLIWRPGGDLWTVKMDLSQIDQVLANLCINARDSIEDVGKITIETGNVTCDKEYCEKHHGIDSGEYVMMTVSDTGCGMTKETVDRIFEPFFTTKGIGKGTGLGLSTVYGIMQQNKGFINVYSEPDNGTTFKAYFPRYLGESVVDYRESSVRANQGNGETILLVEDEPAILRVTEDRLKRLGYSVLAFSDPKKAAECCQELNGIHLLMTDVVMPEMNGPELFRRVEQAHPGIKCLYMSGYAENMIAHHGILDTGVNFISKPFSMEDMASKINKVLDN
jgi:nitrogen-specific signal transduction histidine kinase